ncbi:MAG: HD domain-containing protein [Actinomycetota bacterium]
MERAEAKQLLYKNLKTKNLRKHCLAVEAIMGEIAEELNRREGGNHDVESWRIAGLLHDIDYDRTAEDPERHSLIGSEILKDEEVGKDIVYAIKAHNEVHGLPLKSKMDIALYAADPLSGLIVASALISPEKKLDAIDTQFVLNRFGEKSFARGANRDQILACEKLGFSLKEFTAIALKAMKKIGKEIGL